MNFIKNTHHNLILFFLLLLANFQQTSYCQTYTPSWQAIALFSIPAPLPEHPLSMAQDPYGIFWIAADNRIYRFDGTLHPVTDLPGPLQLACTGNGTLMVAGKDSLWILQPTSDGFYHPEPIGAGAINHAGSVLKIITMGNDLLIACNKGLYRYSSSRLIKISLDEIITDILPIDDHSALVFTESGLFRVSSEGTERCSGRIPPPQALPSNPIRNGKTLLFRAGPLWYSCVNTQVTRYNPPATFGKLPCRLQQAVNLNQEEVVGLLENGELVLLDMGLGLRTSFNPPQHAGYYPGELFVLNGFPVIFRSGTCYRILPQGNFSYFPTVTTGISGQVKRLAVTSEEIFMETSSGLWLAEVKGNPGNAALTPFRKRLDPEEKILELRAGPGQECWMITHDGIAVLSKGSFLWLAKDRHFTAGSMAPGLTRLVTASENKLTLYSVHRNPLQLVEQSTISVPDSLGFVRDIFVDSAGTAWLNTDQNRWLSARFSEHDAFTVLPFSNTSFGWIRGNSSSNGFLLLTSVGPLTYDPQSRKLNPAFPSLPTSDKGSFCFPIAEDPGTKNQWLAVQNIDPEKPACLFCFRSPDSLRLETGLPVRLYEPISALAAGSNHTLWIAQGSDLIWFDPARSIDPQPESRTLLTGLWTNTEPMQLMQDLHPEKELFIPAGITALTVQAQNTAYAGPALTRYRFFLEGPMTAATSWSYTNTHTFADLSPGTYSLRIESRLLPNGNPTACKMDFTIERTWWIRWYALSAFALVVFLFILLYIRWRSWHFMQQKIRLEEIVSTRTEEITLEKEKSEQLLANILPKNTADQLKQKGKASSQKYDLVTVLFSDIQGFTRIAEQMNPETLIDQLDTFYFQFDSVVEKYNIEKIKTIGDAYMCAGGIPDKNRTNPVEVVLAGLEMQQFMKDLKATNANIWDLRIGIHTGPVIAGVVGHKKFSYDIWGDTVNVASRMESSGEAGKVNISGHTYELVRDFFICEYRGRMPVKYKGEIDMYFVKGIRPELSLNLKGLPNRHFFIQLQNLRLMDLEEMTVERLEKCDTSHLYFHNLNYTIDVYTQCELLGRAEEISAEELLILRTAGLLQGIGYVSDYQDAVAKSIEFASTVLPSFKYEINQIETILTLLRSIKEETEPATRLEKIFSDARLNYLGRPDFPALSLNLMKELNMHGKQFSEEEWIRRQEKFLVQHQFHTNAAKRLREFDQEAQIHLLREFILNRRPDS